MPEPPDFDQIAQRLIKLGGWDEEDDHPQDDLHRQAIAIQLAAVVEEVRQVWNARGAADAKAVDERLATLAGWVTSEPYRQHLREAIEALNR